MSDARVKPRKRRWWRVCGWMLLALGVLAVWVHVFVPKYVLETRWFRVRPWNRGVQVQWGSAADRQAYDEAMGRYFKGGASVYARGSWDVRVPEKGVFDVPIVLVAFEVWPLAVGGLAAGGAVLWRTRRREPGARRVMIGVAAVMCGTAAAWLWWWSALDTREMPLGAAHVLARHGVVYVDAPEGELYALSRFSFDDLNPVRRRVLDVGERAHFVLWRWGVDRPGGGVWVRVWMPLWAPAAAMAAGGVWLVVRGRRARRRWMEGFCGGCGYDARGLAVCPECGAVIMGDRGAEKK